jgi:FkbH-like protein
VTIIDLPADPMSYAPALRSYPVFERLSLSAEDQERGRHYGDQQQRAALKASARSLEEFFESLQQRIEFMTAAKDTIPRIAQLTQKTNQFNLTTRRYTEQEIAGLAGRDGWEVVAVRVSDRFGDNGLVGVAITHDEGHACEIDTLLLSCRVIGRGVETAMFSHLADRARSRGMKQLRGWFLPTKKNLPAADSYPRHSFRQIAEQDGGTLWMLELSQ